MKGFKNAGLRLVLMAALLLAWEALIRLLHVPGYLVPAPSAIGVALYRGLVGGLYVEHVWITVGETLLAFIFGGLAGFLLGAFVAMSRRFEYFLYPVIVMFQAMPKVALAPLIIVWFGLDLTSKVINAGLVCFFPLMVNTIAGLRSADADRVSLMRSLDASPSQIFWMLRLPGALPSIFAGLEIAMIFALIGASMPQFWLGLVLVAVFSLKLHWFPASGMYNMRHPGGLSDLLRHLVLPALATAAIPMAVIARLVRASIIEIMHQDYVRTARAKGLNERRVVLAHGLRNALPQLVNITALQVGFLLSGALFVEVIFSWPGIGQALYNAVIARDIPMIQGGVFITTLVFVLANLIADLLQIALDPKVRNA